MPSLSLPLFDAPDPVYWQGQTAISQQASLSGAVHALKSRGEKVEALRQLLTSHGPLTLNEIAAITKWPVSSVCSLKKCLGAVVEADSVETVDWGDGRTTTRTRWIIRRR